MVNIEYTVLESVTKVTVSSDVVAYGREMFCLKGYLFTNIYKI